MAKSRILPTEYTPLQTGGIFLLAYLLFFFLSKFLGFLPGYGLDDYRIVSQILPNDLAAFYVSQGRFSSALIDAILTSAGLRLNDLHVIGLFGTAVFSGMFFRSTLPFMASVPRSFVFACGALLGSHPYYSEYVTFRQSAFLMGMMYVFCWGAFAAYARAQQGPGPKWLLLSVSSGLGILALGINQLAAAYLCIAVFAHGILVARMHVQPGILIQGRGLLHSGLSAATYGAVIAAGYVVVALSTTYLLGETSSTRTELLAAASIPDRMVEILNLAISIHLRTEVVASWVAKTLIFVALCLSLIPLNRQRVPSSMITATFFLLATSIALLPVFVSASWWPVPRTLIAVTFATVATLCLCQDGSRIQLRIAACFLLAGSTLFAGHSNALLGNQARLNRWDMDKARQIVSSVQSSFPNTDRIVLVGTTWFHDAAPGIAQGDLNVSALAVGWAVDPLFDEATGQDIHIRIATADESHFCTERPEFPRNGSLMERGGEVFVCLAK